MLIPYDFFSRLLLLTNGRHHNSVYYHTLHLLSYPKILSRKCALLVTLAWCTKTEVVCSASLEPIHLMVKELVNPALLRQHQIWASRSNGGIACRITQISQLLVYRPMVSILCVFSLCIISVALIRRHQWHGWVLANSNHMCF